MRSLLAIFSWALVLSAEARLAADEVQPDIYVRALEKTYTSLVKDPRIKTGNIKGFLSRPEFEDLSEADLKFLRQSLVRETLISDLNVYSKDTTIVIDDKRAYKAAIVVDFRDYVRKESKTIYINGEEFVLKHITKEPTKNQSQLVTQMVALEKFMATQQLQASLPFLNRRGAETLLIAGQIALFPFALFSACDKIEYGTPNVFLGNVGIAVNNFGHGIQEFIKGLPGPSRHGGSSRPPNFLTQ